MIRPLEEKDIETVCGIVNENWKNVYAGYVSPLLLDPAGCAERTRCLKADFSSRRLSEYVWEENGRAAALLSFGDTADEDLAGAFELWRVYVAADFQKKGIGRKLLDFAERQAVEQGYKRSVVWAFRENRRAVAFYQKNGYSINKEEDLGAPYCAVGVRLTKELPIQAG